ncbi:MAG: hypothetical protein M3P83_11320 [Actinomycetota bacterium]|nr:hypothetical protein [Actinomycetota bacterium]
MPDWLIVTIAVATPGLAFVGGMVGHLLTRKGAREMDTWRRREETMRMLRWAAEKSMMRATELLRWGPLLSVPWPSQNCCSRRTTGS